MPEKTRFFTGGLVSLLDNMSFTSWLVSMGIAAPPSICLMTPHLSVLPTPLLVYRLRRSGRTIREIKNATLPLRGTRGVKLSWCHPDSDYLVLHEQQTIPLLLCSQAHSTTVWYRFSACPALYDRCDVVYFSCS